MLLLIGGPRGILQSTSTSLPLKVACYPQKSDPRSLLSPTGLLLSQCQRVTVADRKQGRDEVFLLWSALEMKVTLKPLSTSSWSPLSLLPAREGYLGSQCSLTPFLQGSTPKDRFLP